MNGTPEKYLIFLMADTRFSFRLSQVSEIREPAPLWPIPAAPPCFAGAMSHYGSIVAVMTLDEVLGISSGRDAGKLIVLHGSIAALAFPVEDVVRIIPGEQVTIHSAETGIPFIVGHVSFSGGSAALLDAAAIAAYAAERMASGT